MSTGFFRRIRTGVELNQYPPEVETLESQHQQAAARTACEILVYYVLQTEGKPLLFATDRVHQLVIFASGFKTCIPGEVFLDLDRLNNQDHLDGWISSVTFHNAFPVSRHGQVEVDVELDRGLVVEITSPAYRKAYAQLLKERSLYRLPAQVSLKHPFPLAVAQHDRDKEVIDHVIRIIVHFSETMQEVPKFDIHAKDSDLYVLHVDHLSGLPNNLVQMVYDLNKRDKYPEQPIQTIQYHMPNAAFLEQYRLVVIIRRFRASGPVGVRPTKDTTVILPTLVSVKRRALEEDPGVRSEEPIDLPRIVKKSRTLDIFEITPLIQS